MNKATALLALSIVVISVIAISTYRPNSSNKKAACADCNVILLSVDSLRADHVSAYGYARDTTPNLDAFAKKSFLFRNYFTTSFLTPVSEMSVHTGLYPSTTGVTNFDTVLPEKYLTLAGLFKKKNYHTRALFSSPEFSQGNPALYESFKRNFDSYEHLTPTATHNVRPYPTNEKLAQELDKASANKNFFMWLAIGGVHWPYGFETQNVYADKEYNGIFKDKILDWEIFKNIYSDTIYPSKKAITQADVQYVVDQYDNGVRRFDQFFGVFVEELEKRGLLENTIIIIQSEHGEGLNEHGYFAHYDIMDTQVHTPLIVYLPKNKGGGVLESFASSVDVFPTITELVGENAPPEIQGKSLHPILAGDEADGLRKEVLIERNPLWEEAYKTIRASLEQKGIPVKSGTYKDIAIRTPEWKYVLRTAKDRVEKISWWKSVTGTPISVPEEELYNIREDPLEQTNVIGRFPQEAADLRRRLLDWNTRVSPAMEDAVETNPNIQPYF